jgi:hypothetical protein
MPDFDWYSIRFLESAGNLAPLVKQRTGRQCSDGVARDIAACLQQGRQFYQSAAESPLEIRPLLLYYGMVGFAKALVLATHVRRHSTLAKSHGLRDVSEANSSIGQLATVVGEGDENDAEGQGDVDISQLTLDVRGVGTFQQFNDVAKRLHRFRYNDDRGSVTTLTFVDAASSDELSNMRLTLKDILSRIPGLQVLYTDTFNEPAATMPMTLNPYGDGVFTVELVTKDRFSDLESLNALVARAREQWAFLKKWRLDSADVNWGTGNLRFANSADNATDELPANGMSRDGIRFSNKHAENFFPLARGDLPILTGGYGGPQQACLPIGDKHIAELSLHFLGLFLLSTLARYRPATWRHAVSRTALSQVPADDRALALIERFLDINAHAIPMFMVYVLNPNEDAYGSRIV